RLLLVVEDVHRSLIRIFHQVLKRHEPLGPEVLTFVDDEGVELPLEPFRGLREEVGEFGLPPLLGGFKCPDESSFANESECELMKASNRHVLFVESGRDVVGERSVEAEKERAETFITQPAGPLDGEDRLAGASHPGDERTTLTTEEV